MSASPEAWQRLQDAVHAYLIESSADSDVPVGVFLGDWVIVAHSTQEDGTGAYHTGSSAGPDTMPPEHVVRGLLGVGVRMLDEA